MTWYKVGKISVQSGSKIVTGTGTQFIGNVKAGFGLLGPDFAIYEVESIQSATQITLASVYRGADAVDQAFGVWQTQGEIPELLQAATTLLNTFGAFRDAYENGDLVGTGIELKDVLNDVADLPLAPGVGDAYLVGTSIYVYTGVTGGWHHKNIAGVNPTGPWNPASSYERNDLATKDGSVFRRLTVGVSAGMPPDDPDNWEIFVARGEIGPAGVVPRGPWSALTAYEKNDTALDAGSQYVRLITGMTPDRPSTDPVNWQLFLSKGLDGLGAVVSVNGHAPDGDGNVLVPTDTPAYASIAAFPLVGVVDRLYLANDTNLLFRWDVASASYKQAGGAAGTFPFFLSNGAGSAIALTSDRKLPFRLANGDSSNIPLTV
ncbi:hypothetical protein [Herbaspirillum sp. NPDC101397]|uniref:hypothetical protein n=1 Tax=Herbaspirillum sp. NPDC101397 TaxID=3364006 RepID=UPI00383B3FDC